MKIGIDALYIRPGKVGGTESYLRNLLKGLEMVDDTNEYYIFTSGTNSSTFKFVKTNFHKIVCKVNGENRLSRVLYTSFVLPSLARKNKIDIMFFPTYIRSTGGMKGILTVSNPHDIQYRHYPQYFTSMQKMIFKYFYSLTLRKSDNIICISKFVRDDIKDNFPKVDLRKFSVIYNPIDFEKFDSASSAPASLLADKFSLISHKYILAVSTLLPHKNFDTLLDAYAKFKTGAFSDFKLVLVGVKQKSTGDLMQKIDILKLNQDVIIPGFVDGDELTLLYNNAAVFVAPSIFEGFGMSPVEAMYKKLPTITTTCTSLPEVTQGKAIYYDSPLDSTQLAHVLTETITNPPDAIALQEISMDMRQAYSIDKIAGEYIDFFTGIYNEKRKSSK